MNPLHLFARIQRHLDRPVEQIYSDDPQAVLNRVANDTSTEVVRPWFGAPYRRYRFKLLSDPSYSKHSDLIRLPLLPSDT